jgi:hypothetical protein
LCIVRFDLWMMRTHPNIPFERYADKAIGHCIAQTRCGDYEHTADRVAAYPRVRRRSNGTGRSHIRAAKARARVQTPVGLRGELEQRAISMPPDLSDPRCAKNGSPVRYLEQVEGKGRRRVAHVLGRFWGRSTAPSKALPSAEARPCYELFPVHECFAGYFVGYGITAEKNGRCPSS